MEKDSFQTFNLSNKDFIEDRAFEQASPHRGLRRESKSETVETLISQNEDLMARLKITLRRMTVVEEQLRDANEELKTLRVSNSATQDQLLIWKEKEKIWKEKNTKFENELLRIKNNAPDIEKLEYQIERYKKYQEKVKTTIKPYLQQLKDYAQALHLEIQELQKELHQKEALLSSAEKQIYTLKEEKSQLEHFFQMNQNQLQESHETELSNLFSEIKVLREANTHLEYKAQKLNESLERQDELENLVVALRRSKEENHMIQETELRELRESNHQMKLNINELQLTLQSQTSEIEEFRSQSHKDRTVRFQLEEQLSSLRFMWNKKCEEYDRLTLANQSLEDLNKELSQSLNRAREKNSP